MYLRSTFGSNGPRRIKLPSTFLKNHVLIKIVGKYDIYIHVFFRIKFIPNSLWPIKGKIPKMFSQKFF
jgi:hypothetical protein